MTTNKDKPWYESLFEHYAETYDEEPYTQGTQGEVDFIEKEIGTNKDTKILDIGCGTGRHAVELAKRGYAVTGFDLSEEMLAKAIEKAEAAKVEINFVQGNALELPFKEDFDLGIMLCAGAFPLMETDALNFQILKNAHRSLKSDGKLIFATYNGLYPLTNTLEALSDTLKDEQAGESDFDLMTFRMIGKFAVSGKDGSIKEFLCNERYYMPSEIRWQLESLGFKKVEIFAAKLGNYSREDVLTKDDYEMLIVAEK